jgi:triacylglycerol lipase
MTQRVAPKQPTDAVLVRQQAAAALRSLLRPSTHVGNLRELALIAVHAGAWPCGLLPGRRADDEQLRPAHLGQQSMLATDPDTAWMPVVFAHGYVHNRSAFLMATRSLRRAGFQNIHSFNYNPLRCGIPVLAQRLGEEVEQLLRDTGADRVQLVGHSLGGIVARYYTQLLGGEDTVDTVITLSAPHRGTYSSYLGVGPCAGELRPGSQLVRELEATARPGPVRWISYYSDLDLLVTPAISAKLAHPALRARNIKVRDTGHLSMLLSRRVITSVVDHLIDRDAGRPAPMREITSIPTVSQRQRRTGADPAESSESAKSTEATSEPS